MAASRRRRGPAPLPRLLKGAAIGIVGTGQVGGSFVRCLSRYRPALSVYAVDRTAALAPRVRRYARWCETLDELVHRCDVVVLAVPVQEVLRLLPRVARLARRRPPGRRLLLCDVSTLKARVVAAGSRYRDAFDFVGLHPLAGTERNGWDGADPGLYRGRTILFCPARVSADGLARELIELVGGTPVAIDAVAHDRLVADGIGLPHVLAFVAAGVAPPRPAGLPVRGPSWRSLTRVVASSPAMVAGFLHGNRANQLRVLRRFRRGLDTAERLLRQGSVQSLERRLRRWQARMKAGEP